MTKGIPDTTPGQSNVEPSKQACSFKIIAGSYEKLLYGLDGFIVQTPNGYAFELKPVFIFPAHVSCIKAVAASPNGGKWLASGSADEIIKVWDLRRRKEIGGLMHHEGSITHLTFPSSSHLLSASEDGTLCLFRARDWVILRSLKGHKGRVNSVAVHPSGKLALSVGKDRTMRMWDLMRGKGSASTKLGKEGELVRWSVDGSRFVVQSHSAIDFYSTDMTRLHTINHASRIHDIKFCRRIGKASEVLLVAAEDNKTSVYEMLDATTPPNVIAELIGHSNRVKAVDILSVCLPVTSPFPNPSTTLVACTISSDGKIHVYDLASLVSTREDASFQPQKLEPVTTYDTKGTRLTCLTLADGGVAPLGPAKRKNMDREGEVSGSEDERGEERGKVRWSPMKGTVEGSQHDISSEDGGKT